MSLVSFNVDSSLIFPYLFYFSFTYLAALHGLYNQSSPTRPTGVGVQSPTQRTAGEFPLCLSLKEYLSGYFVATHSSILAWKVPWKEEPGRI